MRQVLLLDADSVQSICLSKSFRKQGWKVFGFCKKICSSGYFSRFLDKRIKCPNYQTQEKEFDSFIQTFLRKNKIDLIIPLTDVSAKYLSKNKELLESGFNTICAIENYDKFSLASDKMALMELCASHKIPHPLTISLTTAALEEPSNNRLGTFPFPALIKPNHSAGARGITKVNNFEELLFKFPPVQNNFGQCSLQQFVTQPSYYYNVMMFRGKNKKILGSTVIKIRRYFPLKGGSSCYSETIEDENLTQICTDVLDILDWHGFADFDILEDVKTKERLIIEINPRVPSSLQGAFAAGVDFGKVFISDYFDLKLPIFSYKSGMQVRWFGLDVMWFLFSRERFSFSPSWFRFFGKNVSYHDGSFTNPLPFFAGAIAGVIKYLDPLERKAKLSK